MQIGGKKRVKSGGSISDTWTEGATKSWQLTCPSGGAYFRVKRVGSDLTVSVRDKVTDPWTVAFNRVLGEEYGETVYIGFALTGSGDEYFPQYSATFKNPRFRESGTLVIIK